MKSKFIALLGGAALSLGLVSAASAADMAVKARPVVAPVMLYSWSGFYLGVNGGGAWTRKCWDFSGQANARLAVNQPEGCHDATGGTIGGQIGYRWQASNWVFGLEAQGNWADLTGSNVSLVFPAITNRTKVDAFGLFTGQVGYAFNNVLLYVKGGAAVVSDKYDYYTTLAPAVAPGTASETRWGGVIGVGFEYGFSPNWTFGLEYNHAFMGARDIAFVQIAPAANPVDRISQDLDIFTARVNYRFGGPVVAKY